MDIEKRFKHGELTNPDSIQFSDSLKYYLCIRVKAKTLEDIDVDKSIKS